MLECGIRGISACISAHISLRLILTHATTVLGVDKLYCTAFSEAKGRWPGLMYPQNGLEVGSKADLVKDKSWFIYLLVLSCHYWSDVALRMKWLNTWLVLKCSLELKESGFRSTGPCWLLAPC